MEKIRLVKADALPLMRLAFSEGILCKQIAPQKGARYRTLDGHPCVIGAIVDGETAVRMDNGIGSYCSINKLIELGAVETDDDAFFCAAQEAHDTLNWDALKALLAE